MWKASFRQAGSPGPESPSEPITAVVTSLAGRIKFRTPVFLVMALRISWAGGFRLFIGGGGVDPGCHSGACSGGRRYAGHHGYAQAALPLDCLSPLTLLAGGVRDRLGLN